MSRLVPISLAVWLGVALNGVTLGLLTSDPRLLLCVIGVALAVQLVGVFVRQLRGPTGRVLSAQVGLVSVIVFFGWVQAAGGFQQPRLGHRMAALIPATIDFLQKSGVPMAPMGGVLVLFTALVGLATIAADAFANRHHPLLALIPLITIYVIPAVVIRDDLPVGMFLLAATGWLGVLVADTLTDAQRWGRLVAHDPQVSLRSFGSMAVVVAAPALALALLAGSVLPGVGAGMWTGTAASGRGPLQLKDLTLDLTANLHLPQDAPVLRYTTDAPNGVYLRMGALAGVDRNGWHALPTQLVPGTPKQVPGVGVPPANTTATVSVGQFSSDHLPAPYAPLHYSLGDQWLYDPDSLMVVNKQRSGSATRQLTYSIASYVPQPTPAQIAAAEAGTPSDPATLNVPGDVPASIIDLAHRIGDAEPTAGRRAVAIENFLRDPTTFRYSLEAPAGNGYQVLEDFLFTSHAGYCVHYAASMALMARIVGIPSRVAIGFLPGTNSGGTWTVTAHDMHAWPELYLAGLGWIRFEPTVSVASAPAYSTLPDAQSTTAPTDPAQTVAPSSDTSRSTDVRPDQPASTQTTPTATGFSIPGWVGGVAGVLAVIAAPGVIRGRLRRRRLRGRHANPDAAIDDAWHEVRDTVWDLGLAWPQGSPRTIANQLAASLDGEAAVDARELGQSVERSLFSQHDVDTAALARQVGVIRTGLARRVPSWRRVLAVVAPRSFGRRVRTRIAGEVAHR